MKSVREIATNYLRKVAEGHKVIAEGFIYYFTLMNVFKGRDIGSVIFPDSKFKFFLDADVKERVKRRTLEEMGKGAREEDIDPIRFEENLENMKKRDEVDRTREFGPLLILKESIYIDTTHLKLEELADKMVEIVEHGLD
jgi:cytidylate kinase